jgi:hypothetical protein
MHLRAAVHSPLATGRLCSTDEVAVFGTHPYKRSTGLARGFPDSHVEEQHCQAALVLFVETAEKVRRLIEPPTSGPF